MSESTVSWERQSLYGIVAVALYTVVLLSKAWVLLMKRWVCTKFLKAAQRDTHDLGELMRQAAG